MTLLRNNLLSAAWLGSATSWNMSLERIRNNSTVNITESQVMREELGGESQETKMQKGRRRTSVAQTAGLRREERAGGRAACAFPGLEKFRVRNGEAIQEDSNR